MLAIESGALSHSVCDHLRRRSRSSSASGQHAVHQPHGERLVGGVAPAEEHDLARARVADRLEQPLVALDVVGEAELRRRDAELRRRAAVAQVAGERDLQAAAHAEAVDHRERGLARILDRVQHLVEETVVLGDRTLVRARPSRTPRCRRRRRTPRCPRRERRRSAPRDRRRTAPWPAGCRATWRR